MMSALLLRTCLCISILKLRRALALVGSARLSSRASASRKSVSAWEAERVEVILVESEFAERAADGGPANSSRGSSMVKGYKITSRDAENTKSSHTGEW